MYIKPKSVHFDAMTITVVMFGKFVLFSYGKVKDIFWDKDQISSGEGKGQKEGVRGGMGEKPKMRDIFANSHYSARLKLYLTNWSSDKLLLTTTAIGMPKNLYAETFKLFGVVLPSHKQLVNICPQWHRWCRCCRCHWLLQQGDIALLKAFSCAKNTTVDRHLACNEETSSPLFTTHSLKYKVSNNMPWSKSLRDKREWTWIHRSNTSIPNCLNIIDWYAVFQESKRGLNKSHLTCCTNMV